MSGITLFVTILQLLCGLVVILAVLSAAAALCALRLGPGDILDYLREQREKHPAYDPADYPEPEPRRPARREPEPVPAEKRRHRHPGGRRPPAGEKAHHPCDHRAEKVLF